MSANVKTANDMTFDAEVMSEDVPVLVDFTAKWCGPCKQLAPILDKLADENIGRIKVVKVDMDDAPRTSKQFSVRSVPTVLVFKNGQKTAQHVGLTSKEKLLALVTRD